MLHLTTPYVSSFQKTATTLCGRKVSVTKIALDSDATCPVCRKSIENSHQDFKLVLASSTKILGSDHKNIKQLRDYLDAGVNYRSVRFL